MLSSRFLRLDPYVPGEQPKDREYIKLNANENPYPPPPAVTEAVFRLVTNHPEKLARYPDPDSNELKQAIAEHLNITGGVMNNVQKLPFTVTPEMIFTGNGSDEVLSFVFYAFFNSSSPIVLPEHTYSFYPVYAGYYDIPLKKIPLAADFTLNTDAMMDAACTDSSGMIFANPNAPTSIELPRSRIELMLAAYPKDKIFIVDEAYIDFGRESVLPLLQEHKNLLIVRTFSKSLSLAGMRIGYVCANPELISALTTVKNSFNHFPCDVSAQTAGAAACRETPYYIEASRKIAATRSDFSSFLEAHGWKVLPSSANFVLTSHPSLSGFDVYKKIKEQGILVRHFNTPGVSGYVRISIGTDEQMNKLKKVMETL